MDERLITSQVFNATIKLNDGQQDNNRNLRWGTFQHLETVADAMGEFYIEPKLVDWIRTESTEHLRRLEEQGYKTDRSAWVDKILWNIGIWITKRRHGSRTAGMKIVAAATGASIKTVHNWTTQPPRPIPTRAVRMIEVLAEYETAGRITVLKKYHEQYEKNSQGGK